MIACLLRGDIRHAHSLPPEHGGQCDDDEMDHPPAKRMASRSAAWLRANVSKGIVVSAEGDKAVTRRSILLCRSCTILGNALSI